MNITPMKVIWGLLALVIGAFAVLTIKPDLIPALAPYTLYGPLAQILALRGWLVVVCGAAAVFFLVVAGIRRSLLGRGRIALTLALVLLATSGLHAVTMLSRGITVKSALGTDRGITQVATGDGSITVLQYNTRGGEVTAEALANLVEENGVDVVTLPETSTASGKELQAELAARGLDFQRFDTRTPATDADYDSTVMLVSDALGEYISADINFEQGSLSRTAIRVTSATGAGPDFVAIHPIAPSNLDTTAWRDNIRGAYSLCEAYPNAVIAGDFNSTADHEQALHMGSTCKDALAQAGSGAVGTWTTSLPWWFGSPIDRVMAPNGYEGSDAAIVDAGKSDHRGVIVRLTPTN
ncbi:endonuclease/exonuclease/phosphatase family protein [Arcanobacterium haemolyticum]|nr:endonuclease/exonuclease/phosphatase family protein [Arcanobacterium haemolyticum]